MDAAPRGGEVKRSQLKRSTGEAHTQTQMRRCRAPRCRNVAMPYRLHCSPDCGAVLGLAAIAKAKRIEAKADRADTKAKREAIKTIPQLLKETQFEFNAWVRARDASKPCICCGGALSSDQVGGGYDCGHYRSVGSAPHLRFHPDNAHGQRKVCNRWGAGRAVDYRRGLIDRIGLSAVEALESDQTLRKYTRDELRGLRDHYRAKVKTLKLGSHD
jgi:hypothetical protein